MNFKELREKFSSLSEKTVYVKAFHSKRIGKVSMKVIQNDSNEFVLYVNKDVLDTYKTQKEAEKSAIAFAKEMNT